MVSETGKKTFFTRYWWIFAGALGAVALSTALNISNTDEWIVITNPSNDTYVINWNTTRPLACATGNASYWTGTEFLCRSITSSGGNASADGTGGWTNTTTQTTTQVRVGINNTAPNATLDVSGNISVRLGSNQIAQLHNGNDASGVWGIDGGFVGSLGFNNIVSRSNGIKFYTGSTFNSMTTGTERGVINATNGYWGINISQPSSLLHVFGDVNATRLCIAGDCRTVWPTSGGGGSSLSNGVANYPAVWSNSTNITALLINATHLNVSTLGSSGQVLTLNSTLGLSWTTPSAGGGGSFRPEATNYYYKSYDFESVTAGIMDPWAPAAISSGTTALIAGEYKRPGLATVSSSTTASSGYSYQITGATTYLLGNGSGSVVIIAPIPKTGNATTCKLGFQDVFTIASAVDGAYWNASQNGTTLFNWTPVMRTNSVEVRGSLVSFSANVNQYIKAEVYVVNTTQIQYTLYNSSGTGQVLNQQLLNGTVPSVAGRETSHAAICFVTGATTAQVMARLDYIGVYNNATSFNR
jgi:hypothetical protein